VQGRRAHIKRYRQILTVFSKHGFELVLERSGAYRSLRAGRGMDGRAQRSSVGKRLRLALEELGPTFVKLGQLLSTRADVFPADVIRELRRLQDAVPPFPFSEARSLIESELGDTLEHLFMDFEEEPVAAASVAQVHRARLPSGERVAVKVQRPGIEDTIRLDLSILKNYAFLLDRHTRIGRLYDLAGMVSDFEKTIMGELDFTREAENADTFRKNFRADRGIAVPAIKWVHTTGRVLTMEYVEGAGILDLDALDGWGLDCGQLARRLSESLLNQVLRDGFFHADPHPGNIQVKRDGTIVLLDLGMVGTLDERRKEMLAGFFVAVASRDGRMVAESIVDMDALPDTANLLSFEKDIDRLVQKYLTMPMSEMRVDRLLGDVFHTAYANRVRIPREFALLAKMTATLQGILETLAPQMNAFTVAEPIARRLIAQSYSPRRIRQRLLRDLRGYQRMLRSLPVSLGNILRKAESGSIPVQMELADIAKVQKWMERIVNRVFFSVILLAISMIITGILISSGLGADASLETARFNLVILKAALALAALIVLGLVVSMIRRRR